MKRILEGILAIIIAILSCIIFINIILRYGFHKYIIDWWIIPTFICLVNLYWRNRCLYGQQPCAGYFLVEKLSPANQQRVSLLTHTLIYCCVWGWPGRYRKTAQDWSNLSPILGVPIGLMYAAAIPTSLIIALLELRHLYRQFTNTPSRNQQGAWRWQSLYLLSVC